MENNSVISKLLLLLEAELWSVGTQKQRINSVEGKT